MKTRRCLLSQPGTKIGLLICALREGGAGGEEGNKDPDFVLASAEKNEKLIKCSYIKKKIIILHVWRELKIQNSKQHSELSPFPVPRAPHKPVHTDTTPSGPMSSHRAHPWQPEVFLVLH